MVVVSDLDDTNRAEINVVQTTSKPARLVEALLEAGLDQARIRVFVGNEIGMQEQYGPIVMLGDGHRPQSRCPVTTKRSPLKHRAPKVSQRSKT